MTIQSILSRIASLQRELDTLNRQLADAASKEASNSERIGRVKASITKSTSPSLTKSKLREIERLESENTRIQDKKAGITKRISEKTTELHKRQQELYAEQLKEQKKFQEALRRIQSESTAREVQYLSTIRPLVSSAPQSSRDPLVQRSAIFDAFISHASEDNDEVVRPLAESLRDLGYSVWYDEFELKVGDSLRRKIDHGLTHSRFGIVVLSPAFFAKNWPQYELDGLVAKEMEGGKVILPIWHKVSKDQVMGYSPSLADKFALNTSAHTIKELAVKLGEVLAGA